MISENSVPTQPRTREELPHISSWKKVTLSHFTPRPQFPLGSKGCFLCVSICLCLFSAPPFPSSQWQLNYISLLQNVHSSVWEFLTLCVWGLFVGVCVLLGVCKSAVLCCGGQRTTCRRQFSLSTVWLLGIIKRRSSGLADYPWRHPSSPFISFYLSFQIPSLEMLWQWNFNVYQMYRMLSKGSCFLYLPHRFLSTSCSLTCTAVGVTSLVTCFYGCFRLHYLPLFTQLELGQKNWTHPQEPHSPECPYPPNPLHFCF